MKTSEQTDLIANALCKAQSSMAGAKKDADNPFFKSKYADLASVWEACREALTGNGIAVVQMTEPSDKDEVVIVTRLAHSSGQWYEGELHLPVSKADAQGYGSALTYARRYALAAAVGVAPEDDDGNAAAKAAPKPNTAKQVAVDAFDGMPADEQQFLRDKAMELIALCESDQGDVVGFVEGLHLQSEEVLALWALLPSKTRTFYKKAKEADKASKPRSITAAEYAAQA